MTSPADTDIYCWIADQLSPVPTLEELTAVIARLRSEEAAHWAVLTAVRDDEGRRAEVAKRSCWHANGFAKIVLHEALNPQFKVRLHVWPAIGAPAAARGETNAHSHRWDFASTVMCGSGLEVRHFSQDPQGVRHERYRWGPAIDGLQPAGAAHLVSSLITVRPYRDVYRCDTSIIHTIEPSDLGLVATLVLQGPQLSDTTEVYRRPDQVPDRSTQDLTDVDLETLLESVLSEL